MKIYCKTKKKHNTARFNVTFFIATEFQKCEDESKLVIVAGWVEEFIAAAIPGEHVIIIVCKAISPQGGSPSSDGFTLYKQNRSA